MPGEAAAPLELQCRLLCSRDASMLQLCNSLPAQTQLVDLPLQVWQWCCSS